MKMNTGPGRANSANHIPPNFSVGSASEKQELGKLENGEGMDSSFLQSTGFSYVQLELWRQTSHPQWQERAQEGGTKTLSRKPSEPAVPHLPARKPKSSGPSHHPGVLIHPWQPLFPVCFVLCWQCLTQAVQGRWVTFTHLNLPLAFVHCFLS